MWFYEWYWDVPAALSLKSRPNKFPTGMTAIDSEAVFDARMSAMNIAPAVQQAIRAKGWTSYAGFAYACSYVPGQSASDVAFVTNVIAEVVGVGYENSPDTPRLRRLYYESHTLGVQDLRRRSERTDTDVLFKMPVEERLVRIARLTAKYVGHDITGVYEPSYALVDVLANMLETGQLKYVGWEQCTYRDQEIHGVKKLENDLTAIVRDREGFLKTKRHEENYVADISTDLLLVQALSRRSFAFELAGIAEYSVFNAVSTLFLKELSKSALHLYRRVTLEQVENADRYLFTRLAALTAGGLGQRPDRSWPVADGVKAVIAEAGFLFLLMQMPAPAGAGRSEPAKLLQVPKGAARSDSRSRSRRRKITDKNNQNRAKNEATRSSSSGGKGAAKGRGKGRGKGKGKSKGSRFDSSCETCRTAAGDPICFGYQDGSCSEVAPGLRCSKGFHVCWKIACGQNRAGKDH